MPRRVSTGNTSIAFGSNLRIGYRPTGSTSPFIYLSPYVAYNDLPFFFYLEAGSWEVEMTELCPSCSGPYYSDPQITQIVVPNG